MAQSTITATVTELMASQGTLRLESQNAHSRRKIHVTMMRAGTSKGIYIRRSDLPADADRASLQHTLSAIMGSPDPFGRQLNGLGGGTSTTSKLAIVSRSSDPGVADIDYTFVQASTTKETLDWSGNCGNILSGVGPYAYEEGMLHGLEEQGTVSAVLRCLNNGQRFRSTFCVHDGLPVEQGSMRVDGVAALGSPIKVDFLSPAGSLTGSLLPTGNPVDCLYIPGLNTPVRVSCVDAANPFCFVDKASLPSDSTAAQVEAIRRAASVVMGITPDEQRAALQKSTPKVCLVEPSASSGEGDIRTQSWSMGAPHPALQLTGAACAAVAIETPGTLLHEYVYGQSHGPKKQKGKLLIAHPAGMIEASADVDIKRDGTVQVDSVTLYRTARRILEGVAYYID